MKNFAIDLWNDLRAKRLWPVALLLLAGLVAVPLLLSKGSEPPPAPAPAADSARNAPDPEEFDGLASVELEESLPSEGSSLDTFDPSDPFRPPERIANKAEQDDSGATAGGPSAITATVDGGSAGSGGSGDPGGGTGSTPDTGSPADPGTGDDGGSDNGGGNGNGGDTTTTTEYTWVIDVTFTNNGHTRKIKGLQRLDLLPSVPSPLLLFLGASADADEAVFLVDAKLEAAGEGKCKPSASECGFLYLGAGSEHMFTTADGDSYRLRVDQIRKVKLVEADTKRPKAALNASGSRRRFTPPLISDLVSMSTTTADSSNRDGDRR